MRRLRFLNTILLFHFIFSSPLHATTEPLESPPPALPEIHLLVDTSGSMKKTDPKNLRVKVINMFIYLIKNKALMQIQTFATDTKLMIPSKLVDDKLQAEYKLKSYKITSDGQWTDIETALNEANKSWGQGKRAIILLTDGQVDLGSSFKTNQSKNKIMESTLKNLNQSGVRVFAIGFSEETDKDFLDNLALKTSGISKVVSESKDLDNVLYAIFTAIIAVDGTPLKVESDSSRIIAVDKSIHALTLIFKKSDHIAQLYLIDPMGKKQNVEGLSNKDVSTDNYLFVDINAPTVGKWTLTGPKQEIERAIILTDVSLVSSFMSGSYFQGEEILIGCHLAQSGDKITTPALVENTIVNVQFESETKNYTYAIPYQGDGKFKEKIVIDNPVGFYKIVLTAQNKFLSRELQFIIDIYEPPIKVSNSDSQYTVSLVRTDLIKADTASVRLVVDGSPDAVDAQKNNNDWTLDLFTICNNPSLIKNAHINFTAKTTNDRLMTLRLPLPSNICINQTQFASDIPSVQFPIRSFIPKIPVFPSVTSDMKPGNLWPNILFYSIIILLLILITLIVWVFISGIKYGKTIEQLKKQLQIEISNEQ